MKLRVFLVGLCLASSIAGVTHSQTVPGDEQFLAVRDAFRLGNRLQLEVLSGQLEGHVLADYGEYYLLRNNLDKQNPDDVLAFVERQTGNYLGERLRADWMRVLAKKGDWDGVSQHFAQLKAPDQESKCLDIQARFNLQEPSALAEGEILWTSLTPVPEECLPLMGMMASRVTADQFWTRIRLLFEVNRVAEARQLLRTLPPAQQPDSKQLDLIIDKTSPWLVRLPSGWASDRTRRELVALAIQRLARSDPGFAAQQLERWSGSLRDQERQWAWGQIGLHAARKHMPEASDWYALSNQALLTPEAAEWQVRAALRMENWKGVRAAIEVMPLDLREKPEWVYWLGRSYKAEGKKNEADYLFQGIAGLPNFYGNLASEELGYPVTMPARTQPTTAAERAAVESNPGLKRSLALFRLDFRTEAIREWNWVIRTMNDRELIAAADLARRQQVYDRAINTADRTRMEHDYTLRFLAPYSDEVRPAARKQNLDDAWVYGLMRQESRFISNAKSSAGASGLMQLMPATAKWVAKKIGIKDYDHRRVNDTSTNLLLGTSYMRMVMEDLDNHPVLASAAYNAGPGRARRWRAEKPLEGAIYAETIPFSETRDYVKKVMSNTAYYSVLFNGQPASLRARLGTVPPKPAVDTPKTPDLP